MIDPKHLGAAIKEEREKQNLRPVELSTKAGITTGLLVKIERSGMTSVETFLFICEALNTNPSVLFFRAQKKDKVEQEV